MKTEFQLFGTDAQMEFDEEVKGRVRANVATLDVKNANGRMIQSGQVKPTHVVISDWNHSAMGGLFSAPSPPVTVGEIRESDGVLKLTAMYATDSGRAMNSYRFLRDSAKRMNLGWSVGYMYDKIDRDTGVMEGLQLLESSPVIVPASPGTRTTNVDSMARDIIRDMIRAEIADGKGDALTPDALRDIVNEAIDKRADAIADAAIERVNKVLDERDADAWEPTADNIRDSVVEVMRVELPALQTEQTKRDSIAAILETLKPVEIE